MSDVSAGALSGFCYDNMWQLFRYHNHEVGSEFKGAKKNRAITNCVIYVYNVLNYGFTKVGKNEVIKKLKVMFPRQDGMELSKFLVSQGWKAHYWNPDVFNPRDKLSEHIVSFKTALNTAKYYGVTLSGLIVGYDKQVKYTTKHVGWHWPFGEDIKVSTEDPANLSVFADLKKVKFAVGINKGGTHCFLMSYGEVLEVHWDQEGPKLYGQTSFYGYEWNSGILIIPPDSSFTSRSFAAVKAKIK